MRDLYQKLAKLKIRLDLVGDQIEINAPEGAMTPDIIAEIRANKEALIDFIKAYKQKRTVQSSIPIAEKQDHYPLSHAQRRLWLTCQLKGNGSAYNMPMLVSYDIDDIPAFIKAIQQVIAKHEALRTVFRSDENGVPYQLIKPQDQIKIEQIDLRTNETPANKIETYTSEDAFREFDLENGPLLRACLFQLTETEFSIYFNMHHLISDGWSMQVLFQDILNNYKGVEQQDNLRIQYKDFAIWQLNKVENGAFEKHKTFWLNHITGKEAPLDLPTKWPRPKFSNQEGLKLDTYIDQTCTNNIKAFSQENSGSLFMTLLAAWNILCYKYSGAKEITVGTPVAGRENPELEKQIGFYINTLVLKNTLDDEETFLSFYNRLKKATLESFTYQEYPYDLLVDDLDIARNNGRNPLFDVMLNLQNLENNSNLEDLELDTDKVNKRGSSYAKFDLELTFREYGNGIYFAVDYDTNIYDQEMIMDLMLNYKNVLNNIANHPDQKLKGIQLINSADSEQINEYGKGITRAYNKGTGIVELFTIQKEKTPKQTALIYKDETLTYQEVDDFSNQLATLLEQKYQVERGDCVMVALPHNCHLVPALLAILKLGGIYVSTDPETPGNRMHFIQEDSGSELILDADLLNNLIQNLPEKADTKTFEHNDSEPGMILYTSGSTGKPKGVKLSTQGVLNRFYWMWNTYPFESGEVSCAKTSLSFVDHIWELFGALLQGVPTVSFNKEDIAYLPHFIDELRKTNVSRIVLVPSLLKLIVDHLKATNNTLPTFKLLVSSGEMLLQNTVDEFYEVFAPEEVKLINIYGSTEVTADATYHEASDKRNKDGLKEAAVPVGQPIANTIVEVLDANLNRVPKHVPGEVYIAGRCLAIGYTDQSEDGRFTTLPHFDNQRFFKTGDCGYWDQEGNLVLTGRKDQQVKIRGNRVEIGEVENAIAAINGVNEVAVIAKSVNDELSLVAYFTSKNEFDLNKLRATLNEQLPAYMMPQYFVPIDAFARTASGKLDRKNLVNDIPISNLNQEVVQPESEKEKALAQLWCKVLKTPEEQIGLNSDFFAAGGNSLKLIQLIAEYHKLLNKSIELKDAFNYATLAEHLSLLEKAQVKNTYSAINRLDRQEDYAVSDAQKRLWVLSQFKEASIAYNMPNFVHVKIDNLKAFEKAIYKVVERHESLRTTFFANENGEIRQRIALSEAFELTINYPAFSKEEEPERKAYDWIEEDKLIPFNLEKGPLIRLALIPIQNGTYIFYFNMHHIISDGWSLDVISRDVKHYYKNELGLSNEKLPDLPIQYKDYAAWQLANNETADNKKQLAYWTEQCSGTIPKLNFPSEKKRPKVKGYQGVRLGTYLSKELTQKIKQFTLNNDGTLFMSLTAIFEVLSYKYTGESDIVLGTVNAGRNHAELKDQIGFYVNTLALRNYVSANDNFVSFYKQFKENTLVAFQNQSYPFDRLIQSLDLSRDTSRNALFDVMITLLNTGKTSADLFEDVSNKVQNYGADLAKYDLNLTFKEFGERIALSITFDEQVYAEEMVYNLIENYKELAEQLVNNSSEIIGRINLLSKEKEEELLGLFQSANANFNKTDTLKSLFEKQVAETPLNAAVSCDGDQTLTYKELNEAANGLAHYLLETHQIKANDLIAIELERGVDMIIAVLAIVKAGGAYIPIDPNYPIKRIEYIKNDAQCKAVVDNNLLNAFNKVKENYSVDNLTTAIGARDLAYVIYTSGTTGKPKGVLIEHINLVRLFKSEQPIFDFNSNDKWTLFHSYCFDFSVWEMYGALLFGGELVVVPNDVAKSPKKYLNLLINRRITVLNQTPSAFYNLSDEVENNGANDLKIRYVVFGGEALAPAKLFAWHSRYPKTKLVNMYGITETTVHVTYKEIGTHEINEGKSNIGAPIPTLNAYILDDYLNVVPKGVIGELYVGGAGVARGYLNRENLTAERFITNPHNPDERLYKTGDEVRVLGSNELEYIGRADDQVKIRGHRIELGEIENALLKHPLIAEAVVLAKSNNGTEKQLVAYLVGEVKLTVRNVKEFLGEFLPNYMLPAYYEQIDEFPLTHNGKVDKKNLPAPVENQLDLGAEFIAPETAQEVQWCEIWLKILNRDKIGLKDDFFELGGDSILALRLIGELDEKLGVHVDVATIYQQRNIANCIAALSEKEETNDTWKLAVNKDIDGIKAEVLSQAEKIENIEDVFPASAIQRGMIFLAKLKKEEGVYHDQLSYRVPRLDEEILKRALELMVTKHAILRTSFNLTDYSVPVQIVHKDRPVEIAAYSIENLDTASQTAYIENYLLEERKRPFVPKENDLWRVTVFHLNETETIYLLQFHHAILDGWSNASLGTELFNTYRILVEEPTYEPDALKVTYRSAVVEEMAQMANQDALTFWRKELSGFDRNRFTENTPLNERHVFNYDKTFTERLKNKALENNTSARAVIFGAYLCALSKLTSESSITVGLVSNLRPQEIDGDKVLGCFLNTLPIRWNVRDYEGKGLNSYFSELNEYLIDLKGKDRIPLAEIAKLIPGESNEENPFFDTVFNYIDFHVYDQAFDDIENEEFGDEEETSEAPISFERTNTALDVTASLTGGYLSMGYRQAENLKGGVSLGRFHQYLDFLLQQFVQAPTGVLKRQDLLTASEQKELVVEANDTAVDFEALTVVEQFAKIALQNSGSEAVSFKGKSLTYQELHQKSNQFAQYLQDSHKITKGDFVLLNVDRSEHLVTAILAILKLGAAYVPVSTDYPEERIAYIQKDTGAKCTVNSELLALIEQLPVDKLFKQETYAPSLDDIAYVIYTSGSTGKPKGVTIAHSSLSNFLGHYKLKSNTRSTLTCNFVFDVSVMEFFAPLTSGGTLVIPDEQTVLSPIAYAHFLHSNRIEHAYIHPMYLGEIAQNLAGFDHVYLARILVGVEGIRPETVKWYFDQGIEIINGYGPSEATICATMYKVDQQAMETNSNLRIGKPLANYQVYILEEGTNVLCLNGVKGELCISGKGLTKGYLNRPELNAQAFVSNPFIKGEVMYRTGDLVVRNLDGNIAFIGRKDRQVKIRGHRIELGEVEMALQQLDIVDNAAIILNQDGNGVKRIVGFWQGEDVSPEQIKASLHETLPDYMVPVHLEWVEKIPMTKNGKTNYKALPSVDLFRRNQTDYVAPITKEEKLLTQIWEEVLGRKEISIKENFFDAGGDSILAIRTLDKINQKFETQFDIIDLFEYTTIQVLARFISEANQPKEELTLSYSERKKRASKNKRRNLRKNAKN